MKSLILSVMLLSGFPALAYDIESAGYNRELGLVYVNLVFEGGNKAHDFTPLFDACDKSAVPYGLAVRLADAGWDDTGTGTVSETVYFRLEDPTCLPVELTIRAGQAHKTIWVD
jgi:hypothetical protein